MRVFFHCNTLHASCGSSIDFPRTLLHCPYNAIDNSPIIGEGQEHHCNRTLRFASTRTTRLRLICAFTREPA
jgi:hypothetical protein